MCDSHITTYWISITVLKTFITILSAVVFKSLTLLMFVFIRKLQNDFIISHYALGSLRCLSPPLHISIAESIKIHICAYC